MKRGALTVFAVTVAIVAAVVVGLYFDIQRQLDQPMNVQQAEIFTITPGTSLKAIARELAARNWFNHPAYLTYAGRSSGMAGEIKAGEYEITPGLTARQFLALIVSGKVVQYAITIPEGWTFRQILKTVAANPHLVHTLADADDSTIMAMLGHPGQQPEGRFFPDTYLFPAGTGDVDFLKRAYRTMAQVLAEEWQQRAAGLPYHTPYQALIMASIIEKETAIPDERYKIAGVFVRRLQRGIKLQTDPTVIYAVGDTFNGDITNRDLKLDSPYNTYRYAGLPPTPIAAPGRESIRAALQPAAGDELYFVATGDGRHHFSTTLAEHNRAVAKYQLKK